MTTDMDVAMPMDIGSTAIGTRPVEKAVVWGFPPCCRLRGFKLHFLR